MYRTDFWTLWEKETVGCFERTTSKHVYYLGETDHQPRLDAWDKCSVLMHWEDPEGSGGEGRWEGGSGWGIHVNPWLIHVNVWQKPLQYCKVISLQLIKINGKKRKRKKKLWFTYIMEYYSAIKRNTFESIVMRWMNLLEPIIQTEVSQKEKDKYHVLMHIYRI